MLNLIPQTILPLFQRRENFCSPIQPAIQTDTSKEELTFLGNYLSAQIAECRRAGKSPSKAQSQSTGNIALELNQD